MSVLKKALLYSGLYDSYVIDCEMENIEPIPFKEWLNINQEYINQECETVLQ